MFEPQAGIGAHGELVPGPPWILGHRGSPREAPENTLVSLRGALEAGLDGFEYDLHACATGEPVLLHDDTLERTTDAHGPIAALTLPELAGVDAGGWFGKSFRGEPLPLLEEALDLAGREAGTWPLHMIELKEPGLVAEVVRQVRERRPPLTVRLASFDRRVCLEARDHGLPAMLLAVDATRADRDFVRDERIAAHGLAAGGWNNAAGELEWPCERWAWSVDAPADLLAACRAPLFGFNTNEPRRALATRALVHLTPHDDGPYPLHVPALPVPELRGAERDHEPGLHGEWSGRWRVAIGVRNPFGFRVELALALEVRGGAFEVEGLPAQRELEPGARVELPLAIAGGSWSPGDDPLVHARFVWRSGPGRPRESLVLDAPLVRARRLALDETPRRVFLLREHPGQPEATMSVKRRGRDLLAWIENPGGLTDVRACVRLGPSVRRGGRGVRIALPEEFDARADGVPFSVGFEGRDERAAGGGASRGEGRVLRRWAGGLPEGLRAGAPGRLVPAGRA